MGVNPKGNHMIKPRDVGQPEAPPRQKPHLANNIWNLQAQQQPIKHQTQMGYNMIQQPMMQQQVIQPQMIQIQQHPQMGMNMMQMPQMQYGAPQQQQQWKMM